MEDSIRVQHDEMGTGTVVQIIPCHPDAVIFVKWDAGLFGHCFADELEFLLQRAQPQT